MQRGQGSVSGQGTRSHIPPRKILHAAIKTHCSKRKEGRKERKGKEGKGEVREERREEVGNGKKVTHSMGGKD